MALAFILFGIVFGVSAAGMTLWTGGTVLMALAMYSGVGLLAALSAIGVLVALSGIRENQNLGEQHHPASVHS